MADWLEWFPFYVDRFLGSRKVQRMGPELIGGYVLLLIDQWRNGPIPTEDAARISRLPDGDVMRLLSVCFTETPDGWVNDVLEDVRAEQEKKAQRFRTSGRAGAKARWGDQKNGKRIAKPMRPQCDPNSSRVDKSRETTTTAPAAPPPDVEKYRRAEEELLGAPDSPPTRMLTISEVVETANTRLGLGILPPVDRATNRRLVTTWAGGGRNLEEIEGAIEGLALMVEDQRPEIASWLPRGKPITLKALTANTLYDQGDGKATRPLWDVAYEYYRGYGLNRTPKPSPRGGGLKPIGLREVA